MITGADDFSWSELALSAIGVLSIVPLLKPLKPATKVLRKVLALTQGSRFVTHLASALKKAVDLIVSKRGQAVLDIAPFLMLIGELAATEEGRDSVMFMANSIASSDDLLAWVSYFNLPVGGWTEGTEPPAVGLLASNDANAMNDNGVMYGGLASVVPVAHAQSRRQAARATKELIQRAIKGAADVVANAAGEITPLDFSAYLRLLRANKKQISSEVTRMLRDPNYLKVQLKLAGKKGHAAMREAMQDKPDDRIKIRELVGIIIYLEAMQVAGELVLEGGAAARVASKVATAFVPDKSNRHGARFHLMMMAELHLLTVLPLPDVDAAKRGRLVASEARRTVPFYASRGDRRAGASIAVMRRNVDLVTRRANGDEVWWEIKSLERGAEHGARFGQWRWLEQAIQKADYEGNSVGTYHRQFIGDRNAMLIKNDGDLSPAGKEEMPVEVHWLFQSFSVSPQGIDAGAGIDTARRRLCENPIGSSAQIEGTFGKVARLAERQCGARHNNGALGLLDVGEQISVNVLGVTTRMLTYLDELELRPALETLAGGT